ncbi:DUF6582 domain-containing protein [Massilia sp. CMS3.1]|uniref:DUF6582 domain-containing protein n=1 Tax=Massilia sp. CMS3.1 TaxID=3373083 RepID=UPI003EE69B63
MFARHFAFPEQHREFLEDANHVRAAIARVKQVEGVTDCERNEAWTPIRAAVKNFDARDWESEKRKR